MRENTIDVTVYSYGRSTPIKTEHEFRSDVPQPLTIENLAFTPALGSKTVNMRLASTS